MERITSRKNPIVAEYRRLAGDREYRQSSRCFLGQGHKLLDEALAAGAALRSVLTAAELPGLPAAVRQYIVTEELLGYVSPMKSAPELLFVCGMPEQGALSGSRLLLAEDLQDPGNVGTLLRTVNAFGFDGLLLAGACADPFGPKAVRASMGAIFRRRVWTMDIPAALAALREQSLPLYAAALSDSALTVGRCSFPDRLALAVGNEGHGLSDYLLRQADAVLRIPMEPGAESLNAAAAAAVLLWELYRGRG